jgi:hypothetical protein
MSATVGASLRAGITASIDRCEAGTRVQNRLNNLEVIAEETGTKKTNKKRQGSRLRELIHERRSAEGRVSAGAA